MSVSFERAAYLVAEGGAAVTVTVRLSAAAERTFTIDLVKTDQDGATGDDYSGLPDRLMFAPGDTEQSFSFSALPDADSDADESALLELGTLPPGVIAGEPAQVTLTISDSTTTNAIVVTGGGGGGGSGPSPSEVDFEWNVARDIESLDPGSDRSTGIWSNGKTLYIADNGDGSADAVYAYDLATGERLEDREFALDGTDRAPRGFWSDGETVWVSDSGQERLFAYDLATGDRLEDQEIELAEGNADARGIWSDETTVWVLDRSGALFAYDLANGELLAEYELASANADPQGIWSEGISVWVSDHSAKRLFAYRLPAPEGPAAEDAEALKLERVMGEDFTELSSASNNSPRGIWSDEDVM